MYWVKPTISQVGTSKGGGLIDVIKNNCCSRYLGFGRCSVPAIYVSQQPSSEVRLSHSLADLTV